MKSGIEYNIEHLVGSGFKITNYPAVEIYKDGQVYEEMTPEAREKANEIIEDVKKKRGEVISRCVDIEKLLGESISRFFFENNKEKREIFHEQILDTTLLSFGQKKNLLQRITKKYPDEFKSLSEETRKNFFNELNHIIKMRDALAHGEITIDFPVKEVTLQFYDSIRNEKANIILDPDFFPNMRNKILRWL